MFSFEKDTIQSITSFFLFATIIYYFFHAWRFSIREKDKFRVVRFLRYRDSSDKSSGITARELNATFMAGAFSLASAIYIYVEWSATEGLIALWSPITWALGVLLLVIFSKRIFAEMV